MKILIGVGSRSAPLDILQKITAMAKKFALSGWLLRSGGASGCDEAFERGFDRNDDNKEIYLPWRNFNDNNSSLYNITKEAFDLASTIHPNWQYLSAGAKKLHARNCYQCLGYDLKNKGNLLICWTKDGKEVGGTRTALILAKQNNIPIINLATDVVDIDKILASY